jgi:DNA-binding beta-propeller fold protein YncE
VKETDLQFNNVCSRAIIAITLALTAVIPLYPASSLAGELDGWVTVNYLRSDDNGDTFTAAEQRVRLNWNTALSNSDLLNLYFQFSEQEQTNPDGEETRPLVGFNLSGPEYRLLTEYREFYDRNLEDDGFTLETKMLFSTLRLDYGPEYPDLTLDFSRTVSKDDSDEPQTDFVETDYGLRSTYSNGPLFLRYVHRENIFDNNLTFLAPIELDDPIGVAIDLSGTIYVTDAASDRVLRFSPSGAFLSEFGRFGAGEGQFRDPAGIAVSLGFIYVVDSGNDRVEQFDISGAFVSEWGIRGNGPGEFDDPYGVAVDPTGVYITDRENNRVQKFTSGGSFLFAIDGFNSPSGIATNGSFVFVADTSNHRIQVFTTEGAFINQWGSFGSSPGQFQFPTGVAVDSSDRVYVTDKENNRVQVFTTSGAFLDSFGSQGAGAGQFSLPEGIAVTPADDVVVADTGNGRIQVLTNNGMFRFAIGQVSAGERGRSTDSSFNSFNIIYSREFFQGIYGTIEYNLLFSDEKDKDTEENILTTERHDINAELRLLPYRWISLTSLYNLRFLDTTSGDVKTDSNEVTQTYILALQPMPKVNLAGSYTRNDTRSSLGGDDSSNFTTVSLNMFPTNRINVNLSYSDLLSEEDGKQTQRTDTATAITDMKIYHGVDLNLLFSTSKTQDFEADGETDSQRVRGLLRLTPRPNMTLNTSAEFATSDSFFQETADFSSNTTLGSIDFAWAISRSLDLFLDVDYLHADSAGVTRDDLNYVSDLAWRLNENLTFFFGYRGGTNEDKVGSFRVAAKYPFVWDTWLTMNFEIQSGENTDSNFLFVELSKFF